MIPNFDGRRLIGLLSVLMLLASAVQAIESPYHLTGVIASTSGKYFAVIEEADGTQRLLNVGDEIGEGKVMAISAENKTVHLRFPSGDILLGLNGSAHAQEYVEQYTGQHIEQPATPSAGRGNHETNNSIALNAAGSGKLAKLAAESEKLGEEESTTRLQQLLGLPAGVGFVALNGRRVGSTQRLLRSLQRDLPEKMETGGYLGAISVSNDGEKNRVYLTVSAAPQGQR